MKKVKNIIALELKELFENKKLINIQDLQEAEKIFETISSSEAKNGKIEDLIEEAEPSFSAYMHMTAFLIFIGTLISFHPALKKYNRKLAQLQKKYISDSFPLSSVTESYFIFWKLFDFKPEEYEGSMADLCLELSDVFGGYPPELEELIHKASSSRMGLYVHMGAENGIIKLREIVTNAVIDTTCSTDYQGVEGEIWFVRILPPVASAASIIVTTPYIICDATEEDWKCFFKRRKISEDHFDYEEKLHHFMKYGPKADYWLKYIDEAGEFEVLHYDCFDLSGLPGQHKPLNH